MRVYVCGLPGSGLGERFWSKVDKSAGPAGCWPWTAYRHKGYGQYGLDGKSCGAHRLSAAEAGMAVEGMCVCHKCDNPACVNPAHLFVGTSGDNSRDMVSKGRAARGVRNGTSKLTAKLVRAVRASSALGETQRTIAQRLGVSQRCIWQVLSGKTWGHVA